MILEYSIGNIKSYYKEDYDDTEDNDDTEDIKYNENIYCIEQIVSDKIDYHNINNNILHIFPITISLSAIVLLSSYIILYYNNICN